MANSVNPNSNQGEDQQNTGSEPIDLGQSQYNFNSTVFPSDLGMDNNGHYMIININVPTQATSPNTPAGRYTSRDYITPLASKSKVDSLRFGASGSLNNTLNPTLFGINLGTLGGNADRSFASIKRRTTRIAESIALHMPTPLIYNTHNLYEEISLSALGLKLGTAAAAVTAGTLASVVSGLISQSVQTGAGAGRAAAAITTAVGQAAPTISKLMQSPINPAVEILFANVAVRQFTLEVMMAPRNEQESLSMHKIIKTLRFHAAPELSVGSPVNIPGVGTVDTSGLFWIPPAEFDITFFNKGVENMNILRINTCVLERVEVDYSPTGVYSTFRNGHPVAARLSLGLREIEPIHKRRVLQGF
jgi:hypothetical protein